MNLTFVASNYGFGVYSWTVGIFHQARIFMICMQKNKHDCKSYDSVSIFHNTVHNDTYNPEPA